MTRPPEDSPAAVPPYEGRKDSADSDDRTAKEGARTGGAAAPTTDDRMKSPEPSQTERGATASPSDEQPADQMPETEESEGASSDAAHDAGTGRAEDKPS